MLRNITFLLAFRLLGETVARGAVLAAPGPVLGLGALFVHCMLGPVTVAMAVPLHVNLGGVAADGHRLRRRGAHAPLSIHLFPRDSRSLRLA
jgi:hypothetical protein